MCQACSSSLLQFVAVCATGSESTTGHAAERRRCLYPVKSHLPVFCTTSSHRIREVRGISCPKSNHLPPNFMARPRLVSRDCCLEQEVVVRQRRRSHGLTNSTRCVHELGKQRCGARSRLVQGHARVDRPAKQTLMTAHFRLYRTKRRSKFAANVERFVFCFLECCKQTQVWWLCR